MMFKNRLYESKVIKVTVIIIEAWASRTHVLQQQKPPQWEAHTSQLETSPCSPQLEKAHKQQWKLNTAKNK